jgi:hypothetical protein
MKDRRQVISDNIHLIQCMYGAPTPDDCYCTCFWSVTIFMLPAGVFIAPVMPTYQAMSPAGQLAPLVMLMSTTNR